MDIGEMYDVWLWRQADRECTEADYEEYYCGECDEYIADYYPENAGDQIFPIKDNTDYCEDCGDLFCKEHLYSFVGDVDSLFCQICVDKDSEGTCSECGKPVYLLSEIYECNLDDCAEFVCYKCKDKHNQLYHS